MTVSSIGSSGRTYSTIALWEAAASATLSAPWEGECYNDSEFLVAGTVVTFAGITASSTNFIELRPAAGQGFKDHAGAASNPLRYDVTKGVGLRGTDGYSHTIDIQVSHVRLRGLQIRHNGAAARMVLAVDNSGLTGILVRDCILELSGSGDNYKGAVVFKTGTMENCCVINRGTKGGVSIDHGATVAITNTTVVRPSDVTADTWAFSRSSGTLTLTNCAGFGFSAFSNGTIGGSNNASDQAIGFGTSNQASKTYANQFELVTDAARDFRAKSGGDIINTGATGTTGDIIGQAASGTKDIGCWELQAGGGAATLTANQTLGALASSGSSQVLVKASANQTLGALTSSATTKVFVKINADQTLGSLTSVANVNGGARVLTAEQTLAALTSQANAQVLVKLNASQTLGALTSSANVNHGQATITAAQTLAALTSTATAKAIVKASANQTLGTLTSTATAKAIVKASANNTLGALTSVGQTLSGGAISLNAVMTLGAMTSGGLITHGHVIRPTWSQVPLQFYPGSIWDAGVSVWDGGDDAYDPDGSLWDPTDKFSPVAAATGTWARRSSASTSWTRRA